MLLSVFNTAGPSLKGSSKSLQGLWEPAGIGISLSRTGSGMILSNEVVDYVGKISTLTIFKLILKLAYKIVCLMIF